MRGYCSADFENRLHHLFDGRLRIRWSYKRSEWHIEYKISRGKMYTAPFERDDDVMQRAKDGYMFVMAVSVGDRMPCPRCGYELKVPFKQMKEVTCMYCRLQGKDGRYPAVYFPLEGDELITHLSKLDPDRRWVNLAQEADKQNQKLLAQKERDFENYIEAGVKDNIMDLLNIPRVGFGGIKRFEG